MILAGLAAVGLGIWLGLPGRFEQSSEDIDRLMDRGGSRRRQVKRTFTPLDLWRKDERGSERRRAEGRHHFRTAAPEVPDDEDDGEK